MKQSIVPFVRTQQQKKFINKNDIVVAFESIYIAIIWNIQKFHGKVLGRITDWVLDHTSK